MSRLAHKTWHVLWCCLVEKSFTPLLHPRREMTSFGSFARPFAPYKGARRGRSTRTLEVYRSDDGPAYLGHFYYVTSLGDRLSRVTQCKLCNFLRQTTADPSKGTYKLLAIRSSESYLFEPPKKDSRGRPERRPWGN